MDYEQFLAVALEAVDGAEEVIDKYYLDDIRATLKADQSPVTIADKEAERVIRQVISESFPEHGVLGEEDGQTASSSEYLWVIDPIDGTKNYMRKVPLFATQLALMKNGEVVVGVSNAPALGELMYARKGGGTYLNGEKAQVSGIDRFGRGLYEFWGSRLF